MKPKETDSNAPLSENDDAKNAVAFSTVTVPPVNSVERENAKLLPKDGICDWCRRKAGDIFCDTWPICFGCLELMIDRENAIAINRKMASTPLPAEWEK